MDEFIKVKGYKFLDDKQKFLFRDIYYKHYDVMGSLMKSNHTIKDLKEVIWDGREKALKVYFKNGNWWHYSVDGTWY